MAAAAASAASAVGAPKCSPITYISPAKVGSSFATSIFRFACPAAPEEAQVYSTTERGEKALSLTAPLWPPNGLRQHFTKEHCHMHAVRSAGVHAPPEYPRDDGNVVSLFRKPDERLRSCFRFIQSNFDVACKMQPDETAWLHKVRNSTFGSVLHTHGLGFSDLAVASQFYRHGCRIPDAWLSSVDARDRVVGQQSKFVLGFHATESVRTPAFRAAWQEGKGVERRIARYRFVGLTEHYTASVCLFHAVVIGNRTMLPAELQGSHESAPDELASSRLWSVPNDDWDRRTYQLAEARFFELLAMEPDCRQYIQQDHHQNTTTST